jgi:hypothetical protein
VRWSLLAADFLSRPFWPRPLGALLSATGAFTALVAASARFAPPGAALAATSTAAAPSTTARSSTATATASAGFAPFVRRIVLFAPLPVLERIPIGVVFVGCGRLAGGLVRFTRRGLLVRSTFASGVLLLALIATLRFALRRLLSVLELIGRSLGCGLGRALTAERSLEIEVGAEIVRVGRGRSA